MTKECRSHYKNTFQAGDCVITKDALEAHLINEDVSVSDFLLRPPEFLAKYNLTQFEYMESKNIEIQPYFLIRPSTKQGNKKRWKICKANGKTEIIYEDSIIMKGHPKVTLPIFERWNLLSLVEQGSPDKCPIKPRYDGSARAFNWKNMWYSLKEQSDEERIVTRHRRTKIPELAVMQPNITWDEIPEDNINFVLGLPGVDAWKPKFYKNRVGVGYHVKVPTKSINYNTSAWMNRMAPQGVETKSVESTENEVSYQHFYVPMERLKPVFRPSQKKIATGWYAINWCITSFKRFFPNA